MDKSLAHNLLRSEINGRQRLTDISLLKNVRLMSLPEFALTRISAAVCKKQNTEGIKRRKPKPLSTRKKVATKATLSH